MVAGSSSRIQFGHDSTTLVMGVEPEVVLDVGAGAIVDRLFRHAPPQASDLERAIDTVEDALTSSGLRQGNRGELGMDEPLLLDLLGLSVHGATCSREAVEAQFQRLASSSLGYRLAPLEPASHPLAAAQLVILRECLHHLGFEAVMRTV